MKKNVMAVLLSMTMGLSACGGGAKTDKAEETAENGKAETITLTMAMTDSEQTNYYKGAMAIVDAVKEATDGRIVIDVKPGGTLGSETDALDMVIQGDLDIAACSSSVVSNYIPELSILDKAYLWDSQEQANYAIQNELGVLLQEKANAQGFHVIGSFEAGFRDVFATRPVEKIEDFRGLKIRTMQSEGQLQVFTAFGANPVSLAFGEQFTALQQGTIDGCENAVVNCWDNQYYEAGVNSVINTKHCFLFMPLCMSDNAWNKIPDDLKDVFVEAVWSGCEKQWQFLNEANAAAVENLKNVGVTFYDIDLNILEDAYVKQQEKDGTVYDAEWVAAVEAAHEAVQ